MGSTIAEKIIRSHLASGVMAPGEEISVVVDQTLTQDATGTMAYLEFESLNIPRVRTELSVSYVDHNTLQSGFENADDHRFLQSFASRYGIYFSKPGNGICHQVHLERFGKPGITLLGSDSHTPTAGALGLLAIGVGGLEIAAALSGRPYFLIMPEIFKIGLRGDLSPWVSAKDVILSILQKLGVTGGVGKILEYSGSGINGLSVPQRATIANMGAETGATTSVFPSGRNTLAFLTLQKRAGDYIELSADKDASFAGELTIDLSALEPLIACPHSPDRVVPVREITGKKVNQVCIGSCTNSSLRDMMMVAAILRGKTVHPEVSLVISPGSRQVLGMLARNGSLADLISAGARILETACGPCIGMGQSPPSGAVSLRTYNRNFKGRSGTADAEIYLVSPETAAAAALFGKITDPRKLGALPKVALPENITIDDSLILAPEKEPEGITVVRGPNISSIPTGEPLPGSMKASVWLRVGDDITTDDIMPAGARVLPFRSNIEKISQFVFEGIDPGFIGRARQSGLRGVIIGGENYGQGSSREHAALAPRFLGVRVVIARSFARIHRSNLINFGILPLTFPPGLREDNLEVGVELDFPNLRREVAESAPITIHDLTGSRDYRVPLDVTGRERSILMAGGLLNWIIRSTSQSD
ncbi:MAG: aconitate hydratase [Candidatus Euphemobacter frigidus]|nr:aconitate hydratase [Candidatus Euphemobacter frigidus]MDP8274954.1 aconitate hydratase [Candidatus Euphemobacter frigidus]